MKIGMSRSEARSRIESGEYTWDDLRRLMEISHPTLVGEAGKAPSRVNKGMSLAVAFNIHWRVIKTKSGPICLRSEYLSAANLLRDFGDSRMVPRKKPEIHVHHEELINICTISKT